MKRFVITLSMICFALIGYTQVTNVAEFRVADANTQFGVNLPVGSKVYDVANRKYYVATAGVASTETLTTASASFSLLNDAGTDDQEISEFSLSGTTLSLTLEGDANGQKTVDLSGLKDGTGTDDQTAAEVTIADAGAIITATVVEGALQENRTAINSNTANINTNNSAISTNAGNISTNTSAISTNAGNISTNTSAISTNTGNISTNATDIDALEAIAKTVTATIAITSSPTYIHSLTDLVVSEGCVVAINGAVIEPNKYILTAGQLEIKSSLTILYEYDQLVVTYKTALL